jgi:stress-induced morphogen
MNLTASQPLNWKTPLRCLTGQVPDTSILILFELYDEVYYKHPTDASDDNTSYPVRVTEKKGHFVGFSKHVNHGLTYKILTNNIRKVLHRSVIRCTSDQSNLQIDPDF